MYFNEKRENTNIDKELGNKKSFDLDSLKRPLLIVGAIILLIIIISIIISAVRNRNKYFIALDGQTEMTIYQGTTYVEPGYTGYDKNHKKYEVTVTNKVDTSKVGTYIITYQLGKTIKTRKVNVVSPPAVLTVIHLNGSKNVTLKVGQTYNELGYTAVDYIDGDLTDKVTIKNNVNAAKKGTYNIIYTVINSKGVTTSESRIVTVE